MVKTTEICSPINTHYSGPSNLRSGSNQPMSPGARSNPSGNRRDSVPPQPSGRTVSRGSEKPAPSLPTTNEPETPSHGGEI
jgi:hypothetical protein